MSLQDRIDQLEFENAELKAALNISMTTPRFFRLSSKEQQLFSLLVSRPQFLAYKTALLALYQDRIGDEPEPQIIKVYICNIRRKLKPFGIKIGTHWGRGWYLEDGWREALNKAVEDHNGM